MINDLKFVIKCMKFAHNKKMYIALYILFILLGALNFILNDRFNYIVGGYMLFIAPSLLGQMFQTVNMSNLVMCSPKKKVMGIRGLTALNSACAVVGFVTFTIAIIVVYSLNRCSSEDIGYVYMITGIMELLILIYMAFSYKFYIMSSVIFFVAFLGIYVGNSIFTNTSSIITSIPGYLGIVIAVGCIIIGCLAFYGITKLFYKYPMDKRAVSSTLKLEI